MASRWDVTKAVRASKLSAPSRLILLVLADVAEVGTAEIPPRFSPSLTILERETGLGRSTIRRHLAALEADGWLVRSRPDGPAMRRGEPVRYRLEVPVAVVAGYVEVGSEGTQPISTLDTPYGHNGHGVYPERAEGVSRADTPIRSVSDQENPSSVDEDREDVEAICAALADAIEANGSKRPTITKRWRTEARLLLDRDGRTVRQVLNAIAWCQSDTFWRGNVLSMPKLRQQYDRLRLAAQRSRASASNAPERVPPDQTCPEHPTQPADTCRDCAARTKGRRINEPAA